MPKDAGEKLPDPKESKQCKFIHRHKRCDMPAVFLEDYCWDHLSKEAKGKYKHKIENWVKGGGSLEYANLQHVDLQGAKLSGANFQNADLFAANLSHSIFGQLLAVGSIPSGLRPANFNNARLAKADFFNTDFKLVTLKYASLYETEFDGISNLTWDKIEKVKEEDEKLWERAKDIYLRLKNYFHQEGKYDDESKAYYREKLMAKKQAFVEKRRWRGILLALSQALTGFGEHWWKTMLWALGVITLFAVIYGIGHATGAFLFDFKPTMMPSIFQYFYLSVVTFATLGFGDITPLNPAAQIPVVIEVIMGYVFLGLIITIIARRFGR
ncbi:hypothetical protein CEE36_01280 [candidate division TA06 bacterium B3_TA06]|uniref:Potassium channel domain-containing protein n=1 Tax=candidate division TA06 bacterium B3_TA06 TaxID=2012487 RepID=A0A532VB21_UNCT6|nr:MAG: hypothetical protein CEE36_01280 [candidate division TA06 bacterium B3_TA06]